MPHPALGDLSTPKLAARTLGGLSQGPAPPPPPLFLGDDMSGQLLGRTQEGRCRPPFLPYTGEGVSLLFTELLPGCAPETPHAVRSGIFQLRSPLGLMPYTCASSLPGVGENTRGGALLQCLLPTRVFAEV